MAGRLRVPAFDAVEGVQDHFDIVRNDAFHGTDRVLVPIAHLGGPFFLFILLVPVVEALFRAPVSVVVVVPTPAKVGRDVIILLALLAQVRIEVLPPGQAGHRRRPSALNGQGFAAQGHVGHAAHLPPLVAVRGVDVAHVHDATAARPRSAVPVVRAHDDVAEKNGRVTLALARCVVVGERHLLAVEQYILTVFAVVADFLFAVPYLVVLPGRGRRHLPPGVVVGLVSDPVGEVGGVEPPLAHVIVLAHGEKGEAQLGTGVGSFLLDIAVPCHRLGVPVLVVVVVVVLLPAPPTTILRRDVGPHGSKQQAGPLRNGNGRPVGAENLHLDIGPNERRDSAPFNFVSGHHRNDVLRKRIRAVPQGLARPRRRRGRSVAVASDAAAIVLGGRRPHVATAR
mmetsp:Transcript_49391/g.148794  ORF Transcript_49391/g.148794 Transcript_49391/m.148794 type:complete len:397 (-) Transcript_49391:1767-2957(-)